MVSQYLSAGGAGRGVRTLFGKELPADVQLEWDAPGNRFPFSITGREGGPSPVPDTIIFANGYRMPANEFRYHRCQVVSGVCLLDGEAVNLHSTEWDEALPPPSGEAALPPWIVDGTLWNRVTNGGIMTPAEAAAIEDAAMMSPGGLTPAPLPDSLKPDDNNDDSEGSLLEYVKHSRRKVKNPCEGCGDDNMYFGHEVISGVKYSPNDTDYCGRCETGGMLVLINENGRLHNCAARHTQPTVPGEDENEADPEKAEMEDDAVAEETHAFTPMPVTPEFETDYDELPPGQAPWEAENENGRVDDDKAPEDQEDDEKYVLRNEWIDGRVDDGSYVMQEMEKTRERVGNTITGLRETRSVLADVRTELCAAQDFIKELSRRPSGAGDTIVVRQPKHKDVELSELHHFQLPLVIKYASVHVHTLMIGPPAVGKSKMARQTAKALDLPFYALPGSLNPMTSKTDIVGYKNSQGDYVPSVVFEAFTKGGVLFLDELDNGHPAAIAAINDMAAVQPGETCGFPHGMFERHEDFVLIAAANTFGRGPTQEFSGRQRADVATWDRFSIVEVEIDTMLERTLAVRTGAPAKVVDEIVRFVQRIRKAAAGTPFVVTPRATVDMCKMYTMDVPVEDMIASRIRRGASDADWLKLTRGVKMLELDDMSGAS